MTKSDDQLKRDVEAELGWDPTVNAAQIGVSVDAGAVTLVGTVDTYAQKWAAEDAAKRVGGVRAIAQELTVKILGEHQHTDSEMAAGAIAAFKWNVMVPKTVTARVEKGWVTISGEVAWNFEREAAERAVRYLTGVRGVDNNVSLKPQHPTASQVKEKVTEALQRQATSDASAIKVDLSGGKVTMSGHVSSFQSLDDAANAAWAAPGVTEVVNHMTRTSF